MEVEKQVKKYPCQVGMISLIGILVKNLPLKFGNYCSINNGPYLVNMWGENLKALPKYLDIDEVEVTEFTYNNHTLGVVTDDRVPDEWLHKRLCVTGMGWGSRNLCEAICEFCGRDPDEWLCGCEELDQAPRISIRTSFKSKYNEYTCRRCDRQWRRRK